MKIALPDSQEALKLWRNEFLFYLFCGFAPGYVMLCGGQDEGGWEIEVEQQWEQWVEDLTNGEDPRWHHLWKNCELN